MMKIIFPCFIILVAAKFNFEIRLEKNIEGILFSSEIRENISGMIRIMNGDEKWILYNKQKYNGTWGKRI